MFAIHTAVFKQSVAIYCHRIFIRQLNDAKLFICLPDK